ncbi:MAG: MarR family transcriptional regulator [Nanoarchaeota archaeon]|nr:MarR family transcriptional regulator [Nanoarchaeota archaeon]
MKKIAPLFFLLLLTPVFGFEVDLFEDGRVLINGTHSQEYTSKQGTLWTAGFQNFTDITINLPGQASIKGIQANYDYSIKYEKNLRVSVVNAGTDSFIKIDYELKNETDDSQTMTLFIITLIIIFLTAFFSAKHFSEKDKLDLKQVKKVLNPRQVRIIETIMKEGGSLNQNQLHRLTKIPKASLSRHVNELAAKGIIIKEDLGGTNRLIIKK